MSNHSCASTPGASLLINDAARLLGVSRRTVYYRIQSGCLQTIRTRGGSQRVLRSSIEALRGPIAEPQGAASELDGEVDESCGVASG